MSRKTKKRVLLRPIKQKSEPFYISEKTYYDIANMKEIPIILSEEVIISAEIFYTLMAENRAFKKRFWDSIKL